jgi:hypothetical protein
MSFITTTEQMILCDGSESCRERLSIISDRRRDVTELANCKGWYIDGKKAICPSCQKK